ncbi:Calcium binding protein [Quillaja saponaria]|uniref:Calcium binding protein n=1 Tax=Quillaja saponaria TaxID=32244 RepID=A0AAD7M7F3_QUISA|nr:Calcium binding protein [Quillaja saponaria]
MATNSTPAPGTNSKASVNLQDMDELKKVFNRFDANGDGMISVTELGDVFEALGSSVPSEELKRVMDDLDTDHDGFINLSEFANFCRSGFDQDGGASELREAFELYDQDKNGLISATELQFVMNRLGIQCSVEESHRMIKSVDADGDGNVNFKEFEKMMTNNKPNNSTA